MKKTFLVVFLSLLFVLPSTVYSARNIQIDSSINSLLPDSELSVKASTLGFVDEEIIYIKGAFFKEGSSNYFGFTNFNNNWIKNSKTAISQKEIQIGSWENEVKIRVDFEDTGFYGVGEYKFKLGFYYINSKGNISSVNWSTNSIPVSIPSLPSPTPQPKNEEVSAENSNDSQEDNFVNSESSQNLSTRNEEKNNITPKSVKIIVTNREASEYAKIIPIEDTEESEEVDDVQVLGANESRFPQLYIISGGLFILISGFLIFRREIKNREL